MMINTVFKVGEVVRLTILDKQAESGQWFETTVTGTSSQSGILLNLEGFVVDFSTGNGDIDRRTIDRGARFEPDIQKFCFYSVLDHEPGDDRQWDEFKATLDLSVWNRFDEFAPSKHSLK